MLTLKGIFSNFLMISCISLCFKFEEACFHPFRQLRPLLSAIQYFVINNGHCE